MRSNTTERVTSTFEDLWTLVENATSVMEEPLMGFSAVTRNDTLRDVFMLMTTYPGMVLVGMMTTGGNIMNNWQGITVL